MIAAKEITFTEFKKAFKPGSKVKLTNYLIPMPFINGQTPIIFEGKGLFRLTITIIKVNDERITFKLDGKSGEFWLPFKLIPSGRLEWDGDRKVELYHLNYKEDPAIVYEFLNE